MLSWSTGKKSSSPSMSGSATSPPIQQPHSGCHSETKVRKSHGGFVVHVNGRRSPVWASIPLVLAALPCLSATSLWTCGVWNTFQADMGYCNRSSMVSPVEMNVWACACVCEMTSQPSRAEVLQHNSCHRGLESGPAPLQESLSVTPPLFCCPRCLFFPVKGQPRHVTDTPPPPVQRCQFASLQVRKQQPNDVENHFQLRHSSFGLDSFWGSAFQTWSPRWQAA